MVPQLVVEQFTRNRNGFSLFCLAQACRAFCCSFFFLFWLSFSQLRQLRHSLYKQVIRCGPSSWRHCWREAERCGKIDGNDRDREKAVEGEQLGSEVMGNSNKSIG